MDPDLIEPVLNNSGAPVTYMQLLWAGVTGVISIVGTWGAIVLRKKRPKDGAQDAVYEVNRDTILDLRAEVERLKKENAVLHTSRSEFEAAILTTTANLNIAENAAIAARDAARANADDLRHLRERWVASQQYIHTLRSTLARHGVEIPIAPPGV